MLYHILSYEKSRLLNIDNIGFSASEKICRFGPGRRSLYLIHYVISGQGFFNGIRLKAGQGFLIEPNTYEYYYPDENDPWKLLWITSRDTAMNEIFDGCNADEKTKIFNYNYAYTADALTGYIQKNHNKIYRASEMLEIFLKLYNNGVRNIKKEESSSPDIYYDYALNYINSNMFKALRVEELTEKLGVSQPYLHKIFIKKCGMSPKKYIDMRKTEEAKALLNESTMSISEVGLSLGFEDPLIFSAFFKRNTGMSPRDFRKINISF